MGDVAESAERRADRELEEEGVSGEPISAAAREAVERLLEVPPRWASDERTIHMRMIDVLAALPAIGKTQFNTQQQFHFRGHDDVLNALNPLLGEHGIVVVPEVLERVAEQRSTSRGSTMYEVNLHMRFTFYGAQGDSVVGSTWGEGTDMGDKATNKAMTMAFKAVLAQAFAVSTAESYDTDGGTPEETVRGGGASGAPEVRREPEQPKVKRAKNWTDLTERLAAVGIPSTDSVVWLQQAKDARLLDTTKKEDQDTLFRCANDWLVAITLAGEVDFTLDPRPVLRALHAAAFKMEAETEGPPWRIAPTEEARPTREEYELAQIEAAGTAPGEDLDIQF